MCNKIKIAIVGLGYVGLVTGACFSKIGYSVTGVDTDEEIVRNLNDGICPIYEPGLEEIIHESQKRNLIKFTTNYEEAYKDANYIFICVGTPENSDGSSNLNYVYTCAEQIATYLQNDCIIVIKSTVPVGTNANLQNLIKINLKKSIKYDVVSNPEFLSQGSAVNDALNSSRIVIGTHCEETDEKMRELYQWYNCPIVSVSPNSAELIKYASNNFLALKISYINDIANLCELVNADIEDVVSGMCLDKRIGQHFFNAGVGYGGSCFEKDAKALYHIAKENGYDLKTVKSGLDVNHEQKTHLFKKANSLYELRNLKIAVLGLTFKPNTDDCRHAPSLENFSVLLEAGNEIVAFDPKGIEKFKKVFPEGIYDKGKVKYVKSINEALKNADICFLFTEWDEFKSLQPDDFIGAMKTPIVFDGRNMFDKNKFINAGVKYYSIGR